MQSLEAHLTSLLRKVARTPAWQGMEALPLCREVERRVEEANPGEEEGRVSALCHKRLRKLGNAFRCGWELELLGFGPDITMPAAGIAEGAPLSFPTREQEPLVQAVTGDVGAILDRLETLGAAKQANYRHIKAGDRQGAAVLMQRRGGAEDAPEEGHQEVEADEVDSATSAGEYGSAVIAQRTTLWHRHAMKIVCDVLHRAGARRVIDIGSSFNPLREEFPDVTALDAVPSGPGVLAADVLRVDFREGLDAPLLDASDPGHCVAVPCGLYDAALLSLVLRSLRNIPDRREMVRRAALTLREGGLLLIVERSALGSLMKYRGAEDTPWWDSGLERRATLRGLRGVTVNVFERVAARRIRAQAQPQLQAEAN